MEEYKEARTQDSEAMTENRKHISKRRRLLVLDFDDTLFFTEEALSLASEEVFGKRIPVSEIRKMENAVKQPFYEHTAVKYKEYLKPNGRLIGLSKTLKLKGYEVIVLSGRHEGQLEETKYSLDLHKIPYKAIILSKKGRTISNAEWKARALSEYIPRYHEILFFDDDIANIKFIKKKFAGKNIRFFLVNKRGEREIK
ncbi:MAG: hypothetical protein M1433_02570 [Candidatus Parvarchaeota archaeon]|nr:hypothetical protein [Candidatus Parvarchaeota archaeon]